MVRKIFWKIRGKPAPTSRINFFNMQILKKIGKIFLYIILGIIILLFIAGLFLDPIAKRVLEDQVANADEGQYSLSLESVDVSVLGGNFRLHGMRFETDTAHSETPPVAFVTADEIAIEGVSWLTFLLEDRLQTDRIFFDNLNLAVYARVTQEQEEEEEEEEQPPFRLENLDIYPIIEEQVDRVRLRDLGFNDISLTLVNVTSQDTLNFDARELNLNSDDILIDANKLITDSRAFYATYINFEGHDVKIERTGNRLLQAETEFLRFRTDEEMMQILVQEMHFLESGLQKQDTMMYVSLQDFSLTNLDMKRLQDERTGHIEQIRLNSLSFINNNVAAPDTAVMADTAQQDQQMNLAELSFGENMPEVMDRLELDELDIIDVNARQGDMLRLEDFDLQAHRIVVDENPAFAENRFLHAGEMESKLGLLAVSMGEPMMHLTMAGFAMEVDQGVGSISFTELQAVPEEKPEDEMWFQAELGPLNVISLDTRNIQNRQFSIDSIALESPKITAHMPPAEKEEVEEEVKYEAPDLYPAIADVLDQFHLRKFAVIGADITLSGMEVIEEEFRIPALYLQLRDVLIAEGTAYEGNRVLHTEDIAFRVEDLNYHIPESGYEVKLDYARFSTFEQFLELGEMDYSYEDKAKNVEILEEEQDNMLMSVKNDYFRIDHLNFQQLVRNQAFFAGSMRAEGLDLYVYVDDNYPLEEETEKAAEEAAGPAAKQLPQDILKNLETPLNLENFTLRSGNIVYEQMLADADTAGRMEVTDFFVAAENVTNQREQYRQNREMTLRAGGKIMDDGAFKTEMVFDMLSDTNQARITGTVDSLDMTELNEFTTYVSRLAISSGQLHTLNWDFEADEVLARGKMEMSYEDLSIKISEGVGSDTTGVLKDIGAFLANNLVLETDVPAEDPKEPEVVEVEVENEEDMGFVDLYVQALMDGMLEMMLTISFLL